MFRLDKTVSEAVTELEKINQEETYLDWDPSSYPVLKAMRQNIDMYSTLWHTALDFHENYEKWYSGPVSQLDAGAIKTKVCHALFCMGLFYYFKLSQRILGCEQI